MVYVAIQESLQRPVALKVLNPVYADSPEFTTRFLNEGRILASLGHSNVITIYDIGVEGGFHYLSMELLEGGDLKRRMREGLDSNRVLGYVATIADCLALAHEKNVVHRDIKPANVLFRRDGTLLLTDFGIAKQLDAKNDLTLTGTTVGSPHYLSPEQAQGRTLDGRADIYSLGIMAYEMLTGSKPYDGDSDIDTIFKHINDPIPKLPPEHARLQELIERMIAKAPGDRFENAHEVVEYIENLEPMEPVPTGRLRDYSLSDDSSDGPVTETRTPMAPHIRADLVANADTLPGGLPVQDVETEVNIKTRNTRDGIFLAPLAATFVMTLALAGTWLFLLQPREDAPPPPAEVVEVVERERGPDMARVAENTQGESAPPAPPPTQPATDESKAERVERLLTAADKALRDYRLTKPDNNNALEYYNAVLAIDPGNPVAADGHRLIAERYGMLAQGEMHRGNLVKAGIYVQRGLAVHPQDPQLLGIQKKIDSEMARIRANATQRDAGRVDGTENADFKGETPAQLIERIKGWFR